MFRSAVVLTALLSATSAFAKTSLQGQVLLSAAWSDNILGSPDNVPPGPEADFSFQIRPSLILSHASGRQLQRISYTFDATLFATHSEANSYSQRIDWASFFQTSKTTDLMLIASLQQGRLNTFNLTTGSAAQPCR